GDHRGDPRRRSSRRGRPRARGDAAGQAGRHRERARLGPAGRHRRDRRQRARDLPDPRFRRGAVRRSGGGTATARGACPIARGMSQFTVQEIVRATQGALVTGDLGIPITGVSIDSRSLAVGQAFFAIRGHRLDGHAFLAEAAARGAACFVVHTLPDTIPPTVPLVLVEDTTRALGMLAAFHRSRFSLPVVAVTGSNGKTTAKEMIASVLTTRWRTLKPEGSFNNQWGWPLT